MAKIILFVMKFVITVGVGVGVGGALIALQILLIYSQLQIEGIWQLEIVALIFIAVFAVVTLYFVNELRKLYKPKIEPEPPAQLIPVARQLR